MVDEIASGYAEGLVAVARAEGVADRVGAELAQFAAAVASHAELRDSLTDPAVDTTAKISAAEDALKAAHPQTVAAVTYLLAAGRARLLEDIAAEVLRLSAAGRGAAVAQVRTAKPLSDAQRRRLADALERIAGQPVEITVVEDPSLIGGLRVQLGDTVIDGSVAKRLDDLKAQLTSA